MGRPLKGFTTRPRVTQLGPRPCWCPACLGYISATRYPTLTERVKDNGVVVYDKHVGGYCSPQCRDGRRQEMFTTALQRERGKPHP